MLEPIKTNDLEAILKKDGYVHIKKKLRYSVFHDLCSNLGQIVSLTDICLIPGNKSYLANYKAIPLHNDSPLINYIGWFCKAQDNVDGANYLVDSRTVLSTLSAEELKILSQIKIFYPGIKNKEETFLLTENQNSYHVYYAPWLIKNKEHSELLSYFDSQLIKNMFSIKLKPGEALFLDNNRFLHGRNSISTDSNRFLSRAWISLS